MFVETAREFIAFVEDGAVRLEPQPRLVAARRVLARLVAAATALPMVEPESDGPLPTVAAPADWPGFEQHDLYWEVFDPYVDEAPVAGDLSDDVIDIYREVREALTRYDTGNTKDATWSWRFGFEGHWGDHAVDALRALQRACRNGE